MQCPLQRYGLDLNKFEPRYFQWSPREATLKNSSIRTQKLLKMATSVSSRVFRARPALDSLVCDHSRIVLVGEAAHPILVRNSHIPFFFTSHTQSINSPGDIFPQPWQLKMLKLWVACSRGCNTVTKSLVCSRRMTKFDNHVVLLQTNGSIITNLCSKRPLDPCKSCAT